MAEHFENILPSKGSDVSNVLFSHVLAAYDSQYLSSLRNHCILRALILVVALCSLSQLLLQCFYLWSMDWNPCWTFDSAFAFSRCFVKGVSWRTERSTGYLWGEDGLCSVIWSEASCQRAGGGSWWEQFRVSPWLSWDMLFKSCCLQPLLSPFLALAV